MKRTAPGLIDSTACDSYLLLMKFMRPTVEAEARQLLRLAHGNPRRIRAVVESLQAASGGRRPSFDEVCLALSAQLRPAQAEG